MISTLTAHHMATAAGGARVRAAFGRGNGWSAVVPSMCATLTGLPQHTTTKGSTRRLRKRPT